MTYIRIKDAKGGYDLPNMDKEDAHRLMQEQFFISGSLDSVKFKDVHAKGFIIDERGFIQLQIRPSNSRDNPGQIDSSWGSHLCAGDTIITSAMYQSARELGIATTVLSDEFFYSMLENHPEITEELAVTRQIANLRNFRSERRLQDGRIWSEPCELSVFISYFNGKFKPVIENGAGIRYYDIEMLKREISRDPRSFTYDLKDLVERYSHLLIRYKDLPDFNPNPDSRTNELLQQFDSRGNPLEAISRSEAHDKLIEASHNGTQAKAKHKHVRVMLRRPDGTWYLQQRADTKKENYGLKDKPIGGHVGLGDTYDSAVIHECNGELAIPAAVLPEEDLAAIIKHRPEILDHQAVLTRVAVLENHTSRGRTLKGAKPWDEVGDSAIYLGWYNGPITFKDGESSGVEVKSTAELKAGLRDHPEEFTKDLTDLLKLFEERGLVD